MFGEEKGVERFVAKPKQRSKQALFGDENVIVSEEDR